MAGSYDRIARFYDVDMARNMPFDDVGFYAAICRAQGGRALELGCGNGRILLELVARGVEAFGVDASAPMLADLARKAAARGLPARAARMDVRALGLAPGFGVVLCPYSLVTYLTADDELARLFAAVHRLLAPAGLFVVDAFVPRPAPAGAPFTLDYRRPFDGATLVRWKRIVPRSPTCNRIERRYEVHEANGAIRERVEVAEDIRPYTPDDLAGRLHAAGFAIAQTAWDYGATECAADARFATHVTRRVDAADRASCAAAPG